MYICGLLMCSFLNYPQLVTQGFKYKGKRLKKGLNVAVPKCSCPKIFKGNEIEKVIKKGE